MIDTAHSISLAQAHVIIHAALDAARAAGLPPMGVVVLDPHGHPVALAREDGAGQLRVEIATGKAYAAAGMGVSSRILLQRANDNPPFFAALSATGRFIPHTGALAIKRADGKVIGAVGASGAKGDEDEAICAAGVAAACLVGA